MWIIPSKCKSLLKFDTKIKTQQELIVFKKFCCEGPLNVVSQDHW